MNRIIKNASLSFMIVFITALGLNAQNSNTQEYAVPLSNGKLVLEDINDLLIEGYTGSEVIFSAKASNQEASRRAQGLKLINNLGLDDNSGIGIAVRKDGNTVNAIQLEGNNSDKKITIRVPKGVDVFISHSSHNAENINVTNFTDELEITTNYHDVNLNDVTGPMAVKTVYGDIEASFSQLNQTGSISLYSVYSHVDVTLPENSKANLSLSTSYGDVYSNADIKVINTNSEKSKNSCNSYTGSSIEGSLNGGGVEMNLKSSYENIYIRSNEQ